MLNKLKQTAKQSIVYSLGNISLKLIGFILLPLYTGYLSTDEYGVFAILEITGAIIVAVLSFRLSTAMMRWCANEKSLRKIKSIIFTTYTTSLVALVFFNLVAIPFTSRISELFFGTGGYYKYFVILILSSSFGILNLFSFDLLRLKEKSVLYVVISGIRVLALLSLNIYFIKYKGYGVYGILLSQLISNVLISIITLPVLIRNMVFEYRFSELKPMLKYSGPLVFTVISMMVLTMSDRYIIKHYLNYSEVGIYSLGYKLAGVVNVIIIQSFQTGFLPISYKNYDKPDAQRFFSKTLTYYTLILVISSLALAMYSKEIIEIFSKNIAYNSAYKVIPYIALAFVFKGIQYMFSLGLHFVKKTKYNAYVVLFAAILNIGLNFILIPRFSIYGAAIATVISWAIMVVAFYKYSQHFYKIKYEIGKITSIIAIGISLYFISLLFNDVNIILAIFLKFVLILIFPLILYFFNFYEKIEIRRVKEFILKLKKG